jgi:hypothetical protein
MSVSGQVELTTQEFQDELQFCLKRKSNPLMLVVIPGLLFLFMLNIIVPLYAVEKPLGLIMFSIFVAGVLWVGINAMRNWNRTYITTLSVTGQRLEATGDSLASDWAGHYTRPGKVTMPVSEIKTIGYSLGGKYSPSGFWATCGFLTSSCLLPGLNREQATAVAIAITKRFPEIGSRTQPGQ